jgi:hypothetical protein
MPPKSMPWLTGSAVNFAVDGCIDANRIFDLGQLEKRKFLSDPVHRNRRCAD